MISLYSTWFIPVAIRDSKTGGYLGFRNRAVLFHVIFLTALESLLLIPQLGMSFFTVVRVGFCIALPFGLALLYVNMTQKQMFGTKFSMKGKEQEEK